MVRDSECFDRVMVVCDEERLDRLEAENGELRAELDTIWKFLAEVFEGKFKPSVN